MCKIIMNTHFRLFLSLHSVSEHGKVGFFEIHFNFWSETQALIFL